MARDHQSVARQHLRIRLRPLCNPSTRATSRNAPARKVSARLPIVGEVRAVRVRPRPVPAPLPSSVRLRDEPLRRRAKDDRFLQPSMRLRAYSSVKTSPRARSTRQLRLASNTLPRKMFDFVGEASRRYQPDNNFKAVLAADHESSCPFPGAVCTSPVPAFPSSFCRGLSLLKLGLRVRLAAERDVLAEHHQAGAIQPRMTTLQTIKPRARKTRQHFRLAESAFLTHRFRQISRDDINLITVLNRDILEERVDGDTEVGGQRPRRRRPDEKETLRPASAGSILWDRSPEEIYVNGGLVCWLFHFRFGEAR